MENLMTATEFLDAELQALEKHEFADGKQTTMAGGDYFHNKVKFEIAMWLEQLFRVNGMNFEVLDSDTKTWFPTENRFVYPDITVVASPPQFFVTAAGAVRRDAIVNPTLIVEVLSDETRAYDLGEKFDRYCTLPSFREYLLVEPGFAWAKTIYIENPEEGIQRVKTARGLDASVTLQSLQCELPLAEVYKMVRKLEDWPMEGR